MLLAGLYGVDEDHDDDQLDQPPVRQALRIRDGLEAVEGHEEDQAGDGGGKGALPGPEEEPEEGDGDPEDRM